MRVQVENPGPKARKRKAGKMPKATTKKSGKKNPKRSSAKKPGKRNPKRDAAKRPKKNPKRAAAKRPRAKNPKGAHTRRNARRRRRNPSDWSNVMPAVKALAWGVGASIASSWVADKFLANSSGTVQNIALVAEGAIAVRYLDDPMTLGGVVVGLGLVWAGNMIFGAFPGIVAPMMGAGGGGSPLAAGGGPIGALHQGNLRALRRADKKIAALHRGNIRALHRGMGALHRGENRNIAAVMHHNIPQQPRPQTAWQRVMVNRFAR